MARRTHTGHNAGRNIGKSYSSRSTHHTQTPYALEIREGYFCLSAYTWAFVSCSMTGYEAAVNAWDNYSANNTTWMILLIVAAVASAVLAAWISSQIYDSYKSLTDNHNFSLRCSIPIGLITINVWRHEPHIPYLEAMPNYTPDPAWTCLVVGGSTFVVWLWSMLLGIKFLAVISGVVTVLFLWTRYTIFRSDPQ